MPKTREAIQALFDQQYPPNWIICKSLLDLPNHNGIEFGTCDDVVNSLKLKKRQADILALRFNRTRVYTYQEIASEVGMTRGGVQWNIKAISKKLRAAMIKRGISFEPTDG